jgi:hypothetical protein
MYDKTTQQGNSHLLELLHKFAFTLQQIEGKHIMMVNAGHGEHRLLIYKFLLVGSPLCSQKTTSP